MKNPETAKRLSEALASKNMLPSELAAKSGVSKASISQYVNGTHVPSNISSSKMAKVLKVNPLWLMGFDVPKNIAIHDYNPLKDAKWDKFRETFKMSASNGNTADTLQPLLDAWMSLSDEGQEQLISYAKFLLSQENE